MRCDMEFEQKIKVEKKILALKSLKQLLKTPPNFDANSLKKWGADLLKSYESIKSR
jgi:hypothetical protein